MGWRGVTRSVIAASRAAERERQKQIRALSRAEENLERSSGRLEAEVERELERVAQLEQKLAAKPITFAQFEYSEAANGWRSKEFGDNTGQIKWKLALKIETDARASGRILDSGRSYDLLSVGLSRWGVFVSFRVANASETKSTKLLNKTTPSSNKVFLIADSVAHRAFDGNLDLEVPVGTSLIASVVLPLPEVSARKLAIEFILKSGSVRLDLPEFPADAIEKAKTGQSLHDMVKAGMDNEIAETRGSISSARQQIAKHRESSNSGVSPVIWVVGIIVLIIVLVQAA